MLNGIKFTNVTDGQFPLRNPGEPYLPSRFYEIGIPMNKNASVTIQEVDREVYADKFIIATPDSAGQPIEKLNYAQEIYGSKISFPASAAEINSQAIFRYIKTASLSVSPFQFNPVERTLIFNKRIKIKIDFQQDVSFTDLITPVS
ncbi:MAG TPA: C25 family peptidase propeptide domain-containing protein, partial [Ignavibacteriaceae bacterium]|nr:C25 family peptidase propeptide domain-containing protein [Ignavibacteriaceae bacterium]